MFIKRRGAKNEQKRSNGKANYNLTMVALSEVSDGNQNSSLQLHARILALRLRLFSFPLIP